MSARCASILKATVSEYLRFVMDFPKCIHKVISDGKMLKSQSSPFCSWYDNLGFQVDSQLIKWIAPWAAVRTSCFWSWICPDLPLTLGFPPSPRRSDQHSLKMPSSSGNAAIWFGFGDFSLSAPNQFQFEVKEIPKLLFCILQRIASHG